MKTITPQPIWVDGISKLASVIFSQVNSDNMKDTATFYFQLYQEVDVNIVPLVNGTINMTGADYTTYNSSSDANDYAWTWIATTLGLTITGEYIPPPTPAELEQASKTELEQQIM
jgi:hypothetical protein